MKMRSSFALIATLAITATLLADDGAAKKKLSPEERAARRAQHIAQAGGFITAPVTGKVMRVVNAQKAVDASVVAKFAAEVMRSLNFPVEALNRAGDPVCPIEMVGKLMNDTKAGAVVACVEDDKLPSVLVAPENGWAIVNVKALATDGASGEALAGRVRKECLRATAMALGAANSNMMPCLMTQVREPKDLDNAPMAALGPEPSMKVAANIGKFGIEQFHRATYRRACMEGWAPSPTNDIQKAIWDEVHAKPSKPMKIKYDPARGI